MRCGPSPRSQSACPEAPAPPPLQLYQPGPWGAPRLSGARSAPGRPSARLNVRGPGCVRVRAPRAGEPTAVAAVGAAGRLPAAGDGGRAPAGPPTVGGARAADVPLAVHAGRRRGDGGSARPPLRPTFWVGAGGDPGREGAAVMTFQPPLPGLFEPAHAVSNETPPRVRTARFVVLVFVVHGWGLHPLLGQIHHRG